MLRWNGMQASNALLALSIKVAVICVVIYVEIVKFCLKRFFGLKYNSSLFWFCWSCIKSRFLYLLNKIKCFRMESCKRVLINYKKQHITKEKITSCSIQIEGQNWLKCTQLIVIFVAIVSFTLFQLSCVLSFSLKDEKLEHVLGHFQKDFEGGVSAENLGKRN